MSSNWLLTKESQWEAKGETKDFNGSQEAKGFGGNINFYSKKDLTEIKNACAKCRKFGLKNFTISVKNALASCWLLKKGSQGEAKSEAKDFSGSQEAKGFRGNINFYSKKDLTEIKKRMRKCRKFGLGNFTISVKNALASS